MSLFTMVFLIFLFVVPCLCASGNNDTIYYFPELDDECIHPCDKHDYGYYWCKVVSDTWRYCSLNPYTDYYGRNCTDACRYYERGKYYYCNVEGGGWGYCSKWRKRPSITHYVSNRQDNKRDKCISSCQRFSSTHYYWCRTVSDAWDYCSPAERTTTYGKTCYGSSVCRNYGYSFDWCYYSWFDAWGYCGKVEDKTIHSSIFIKNAALYPSINYQVTFTHDAREEPPPETFFVVNETTSKRFPRAVCDDVSYVNDTVVAFNTIFQEFELQLNLRGSGMIVNRPRNERNPIVRSFRRGIRPGVSRVEGIHARIERRHFQIGRDGRVNFPQRDLNYMREELGAQIGDERGHLVASSFGGPPERYNLVPQHESVNRNAGVSRRQWSNEWFAVETRMRHFFRHGEPGDASGYIDWVVVVYYHNLTVGRPHAFHYLALFYDWDGQLIYNEQWFPLAGISYNSPTPQSDSVRD